MVNWKAPENIDRLIAVLLAANPGVKLDYTAMAALFGQGATYDTINCQFRRYRRQADEIRAEAAKSGMTQPVRGRNHPSSGPGPAIPRTPRGHPRGGISKSSSASCSGARSSKKRTGIARYLDSESPTKTKSRSNKAGQSLMDAIFIADDSDEDEDEEDVKMKNIVKKEGMDTDTDTDTDTEKLVGPGDSDSGEESEAQTIPTPTPAPVIKQEPSSRTTTTSTTSTSDEDRDYPATSSLRRPANLFSGETKAGRSRRQASTRTRTRTPGRTGTVKDSDTGTPDPDPESTDTVLTKDEQSASLEEQPTDRDAAGTNLTGSYFSQECDASDTENSIYGGTA